VRRLIHAERAPGVDPGAALRPLVRTRLAIAALVLIGLTVVLLMPVEQFRFRDPSGQFTAVVSSRRILSYLPAMPGQGSDKPGFVTILDSQGRDLGRIPVDMIWMAHDLEWQPDGAKIKLVGEWDFRDGTVSYWTGDQSRLIRRRVQSDGERVP